MEKRPKKKATKYEEEDTGRNDKTEPKLKILIEQLTK
jgi:hypothetical protein